MIRITVDQATSHLDHWLALITKGEEIVGLDHEKLAAGFTDQVS